jgi:hypothetical protein
VFYSILMDFGIPVELVRLIKMCLNIIHIKAHIGNLLSDTFLFNLHCFPLESKAKFPTFLSKTPLGGSKKIR